MAKSGLSMSKQASPPSLLSAFLSCLHDYFHAQKRVCAGSSKGKLDRSPSPSPSPSGWVRVARRMEEDRAARSRRGEENKSDIDGWIWKIDL